jgi:hypothetical protein
MINLAKKRLVRYGLLAVAGDKRLAITPRGESFLDAGFTRLDVKTRDELDRRARRLVQIDGGAAAPAASCGPSSTEEDVLALAGALDDAGLTYTTAADGSYVIPIQSELRSWLVEARIIHGWVCLRAHVMRVPSTPLLKSALVEAVMRRTSSIFLWRFCISDRTVMIDADYRLEDVTGERLNHLVRMLGGAPLEKMYAEFVRIATSAPTLDALEAAFKGTA